MKRVCAWCGHDMGIAPGPEDQVTHGVCELCLAWIRLRDEQLLDQLSRLQEHIRRRQAKRRAA